MASDEDRPGPGDRPAPERRKRPVEPRPLELQATEMRDETQPGDRPQPQAAGPSGEEAGSEAASAQQEPQDEAAAAERASDDGAEDSGRDEGPDQSSPSGHSEALPQGESAGAPTAPPPRQSRSVAALLAAGIGGGLVALLLMLGLGLAGIWPPAEDSALRAELASTQARLAALEEADAGPPGAVDPADVEQLAGRVAALEEAEIDIPPAADPEAVEALTERLEALEGQFAGAGDTQDLSAMEERLSALEAAAAEMATSEDMDEALAEIGERVDELAGVLSGLAEGIGPDPQVTERLSQLETAVAEERGERQSLASRVENLEGRLDQAAAAADRRLARAAASSVMLSGLARAVETGRTYEDELAALEPLIDDPQAIETLAAHAEAGLPTAAELAERFSERVTAILGAQDNAGEAPGFLGRISDVAGSLVRVRPAAPMEGDSRAAIISRIEGALATGNLDVAHEEWQRLDAPAREASAQWASALAERLAAEDELKALFAEVSAALGQRADGAQ